MSQDELAKAAGLTKQGISKIEDGAVQPREGTLDDIVRVFTQREIEFIDHQGVRFRPNDVEVFEGPERFEQFYTFMYDHLEMHGGEVCLSCVDEYLFAKHRKDIEAHRKRMSELVGKGRISVRVMATKSHFSAPWAEYRWQRDQSTAPTAFYAFGNCLALVSFSHQNPPFIVLIESGPFAEAYRAAFNTAWDKAPLPRREA